MTDAPRFDPEKLTSAANDTVTVRRVFGEAYEREGTLVIPVAKVWAATGLGLGDGEGTLPAGMQARFGRPRPDEEPVAAPGDAPAGAGYGGGHGGGGGYGAHVRPVGVYVVDDAGVHWQPSLDVNRVILGGQAVAATAVLAFAAAFAVKAVAHVVGAATASIAQSIASR